MKGAEVISVPFFDSSPRDINASFCFFIHSYAFIWILFRTFAVKIQNITFYVDRY